MIMSYPSTTVSSQLPLALPLHIPPNIFFFLSQITSYVLEIIKFVFFSGISIWWVGTTEKDVVKNLLEPGGGSTHL